MPITPSYPGLYIEEIPSNSHTITGVPTSVTVFIGYTHPFNTQTFGRPMEIFSFADYDRLFGGFFTSSRFEADIAAGLYGDMAMAVYQFFQNGGTHAYVVGLQSQKPNHTYEAKDFTTALQADGALAGLSIFNLLVIPGVTDPAILSAASSFCLARRAFLIMDPKIDDTPATVKLNSTSKNSALYFPWLSATNPTTGVPIVIPPSGSVAGIYAATDQNAGVWKAPAGLQAKLNNVTDVVSTGRVTDQQQAVLDLKGINCIRNFPDVGTVVWGSRTSVSANPSFEDWKYVPVRRMALFLEQTLYANLAWVVFEPNAQPLWTAIANSIESFMMGLFRQGAFQGNTPSEAFQVKCDDQTTTQTDINNGIVNIVVGFAPLQPAEFVIIQIAQLAGQTQTS